MNISNFLSLFVWAVVFSVSQCHTLQRLASSAWDSSIKIWDMATGECLATLAGHRNVAAIEHLGVVFFSSYSCDF